MSAGKDGWEEFQQESSGGQGRKTGYQYRPGRKKITFGTLKASRKEGEGGIKNNTRDQQPFGWFLFPAERIEGGLPHGQRKKKGVIQNLRTG